MKLRNKILLTELLTLVILFCSSLVYGQVESFDYKSEDGGSMMLTKEIPVANNIEITGDGEVVEQMYVVQLARFEKMPEAPDFFPKGSMLWVNPDHPNEKLLLVGFYNTLEDARLAAEEWKVKSEQFQFAFARQQPFFIRYY
ncbi:MAG: hypothetical protein AAF502_24425 [Bacteroidota bacterium]